MRDLRERRCGGAPWAGGSNVGGLGTLQAEVLSIKANQDQSGVTILLAGEFDLTDSQRFWSCISDALAAKPNSMTVDARGLEFIDSSGLMALVRARDAAAEAGVAFRVSEPSPAVRRIAEMCGLENLLSDQ